MYHESLTVLVHDHLNIAIAVPSGRSAHTIHGGQGHLLNQTLIALRAGSQLSEYENTGEATIQILHGHVQLVVDTRTCTGVAGDIIVVPQSRHALKAAEDSVVLLTVATRHS